MNPDANFQGQPVPVPQGPQSMQNNTAQDNAAIENKYIMDTARQLVNDEMAQPGSQDPDALTWARNKLANGPTAPSAPVPVPPSMVNPAPVAPVAQDPAANPGQTIQPQSSPDTLHVRHDDEPGYQDPQGTITPRNGEQ